MTHSDFFCCVGKGGKNRRRGKNENEEKRELIFKEDGQGKLLNNFDAGAISLIASGLLVFAFDILGRGTAQAVSIWYYLGRWRTFARLRWSTHPARSVGDTQSTSLEWRVIPLFVLCRVCASVADAGEWTAGGAVHGRH